jgi:DNA mismatch repair protein MutS2
MLRKKKYPTDPTPPLGEVHLRQLTVDEALWKLDKYLNDAFMAGLYQVRVVHGKGTGTLRQAVREKLARHPLVQSHRPGEYGEGGAGVTVVELAPK